MKKVILLCALVFFLTGCTSINDSSIDTLITEAIGSKFITRNVSRRGYRFYLPKGLSIKDSYNFNEVITNNQYVFYLHVDIVSFNNKTEYSYTPNEASYYSRALGNNGNKGYIEINNYKNNQYLIEIMYNYAKIEVIGYERDIKNIVTYAMSVVTSITYNENVIKNYLGNNIFNSIEEGFDIFEVTGSDNYVQFTEDVDTDEKRKDSDYVD